MSESTLVFFDFLSQVWLSAMLAFKQEVFGAIVCTMVMIELLIIVEAVPSVVTSGITQAKFRVLVKGGSSSNNHMPRMQSIQLSLQCALKCEQTTECYGYAINRHDHSCHLRIFGVHVLAGRVPESQEILYRVGYAISRICVGQHDRWPY